MKIQRKIWRRNPGYRPEFLNIREMIEVRNYDGSMTDIGEAGTFIWTYGFGNWDLHEYCILSEANEEVDGSPTQDEKPSETEATVDLGVLLEQLRASLSVSPASILINKKSFDIEYRDAYFSCETGEEAIDILDAIALLEKYYVV